MTHFLWWQFIRKPSTKTIILITTRGSYSTLHDRDEDRRLSYTNTRLIIIQFRVSLGGHLEPTRKTQHETQYLKSREPEESRLDTKEFRFLVDLRPTQMERTWRRTLTDVSLDSVITPNRTQKERLYSDETPKITGYRLCNKIHKTDKNQQVALSPIQWQWGSTELLIYTTGPKYSYITISGSNRLKPLLIRGNGYV